MTFPSVQFVASPDEGAEVRFDFNTAGEWADDETWPDHAGWSLGAPTLEGDPDGIGTQYGFRELSFNLTVRGSNSAVATQVSALARELRRQTNWLRFQLSELSEPVWFKTYRSAPGALDFELVLSVDDSRRNLWGVGVSLDADSFAYGAEVTLLSSTTVSNNPAGTNPLSVSLPAVVGDTPAPIHIEATQIPGGGAGSRILFSVADAAPTFVQVGTGDGMTAGTDTGAAVADATFSGGSYRSVSFATNTALTTRLSFLTPTMAVGTYRVMVRVARSDTDSTFGLQLYSDYTRGTQVNFDRSVTSTSGYAQWVDLGVFNIPDTVLSTSAVAGTAAANVSLIASRLSGTGAMRVDTFAFIPVQLAGAGTEPAVSLWSTVNLTQSGNPYRMEWDGIEESFQFHDSGTLYGAPPPINAGAFPLVRPGESNTLVIFARTDATTPLFFGTVNNGDLISASTILSSVSYRPQWLYLAAG